MARTILLVSALFALASFVSAAPRPADVKDNLVGVGLKDILNDLKLEDILTNIDILKNLDLSELISDNNIDVLRKRDEGMKTVRIDRTPGSKRKNIVKAATS
ncbi:hypothetical protein CU098_009891 [Rhizopus stolonifer]|uniref:Uncharacterized protein n=1 Tax=Rhizopus stolonifer TaxID=4846 RepID=A0A367KQD4_RHIST|nr:hypothetical protein CU098_009891 [Rhizopus stolonifer]